MYLELFSVAFEERIKTHMWTLKADITRSFQNQTETYWAALGGTVSSCAPDKDFIPLLLFHPLFSIIHSVILDFILYINILSFTILLHYFWRCYSVGLVWGLWICILISTPPPPPPEKTNLVFMWEAAWLKFSDHSLCPIVCISWIHACSNTIWAV